MTIIITAAVPRFRRTLTTIQISNTAHNVAQAMRFLRTKAEAEHKEYSLRFELEKGTYLSSGVKQGNIPDAVDIALTVNPVTFYADGTIDKAYVYVFRGTGEFLKDIDKAVNKDFTIGQIQDIAHSGYIYIIKTHPSTGAVEVVTAE